MSAGLHHSELHPKRGPSPTTAHPVKPAFSPMAAPTRRLVTLVGIEAEGWARKPDLAHPNEACAVRATLSDGRVIERDALMMYAPNERERVMEAVLKGTGTSADVRLAQGILLRRIRAVERVRGELQREFGNGVPA